MDSNAFLLSFGMKPEDFCRTEWFRQERVRVDVCKREDGGGQRRRPDHDRRGLRIPQLRAIQEAFPADEVEQEGMRKGRPFGRPQATTTMLQLQSVGFAETTLNHTRCWRAVFQLIGFQQPSKYSTQQNDVYAIKTYSMLVSVLNTFVNNKEANEDKSENSNRPKSNKEN